MADPTSRADWASMVLAAGGWPATPMNVSFLTGWSVLENPWPPAPGNAYNELNVGPHHVYSGWPEGIAATAGLIHSGYPAIASALASGNALGPDLAGTLGADLRKWSGGGYATVPAGGGTPTAGAIGTATNVGISLNPLSSFGDVAKAITGMVQVIIKPFEWLTAAAVWMADPHNWLRVVEVGIGVGLVWQGAHMLTGGAVNSPAGAIKAAGNRGGRLAAAGATGGESEAARAATRRPSSAARHTATARTRNTNTPTTVGRGRRSFDAKDARPPKAPKERHAAAQGRGRANARAAIAARKHPGDF